MENIEQEIDYEHEELEEGTSTSDRKKGKRKGGKIAGGSYFNRQLVKSYVQAKTRRKKREVKAIIKGVDEIMNKTKTIKEIKNNVEKIKTHPKLNEELMKNVIAK
jgi:hypothetical protein